MQHLACATCEQSACTRRRMHAHGARAVCVTAPARPHPPARMDACCSFPSPTRAGLDGLGMRDRPAAVVGAGGWGLALPAALGCEGGTGSRVVAPSSIVLLLLTSIAHLLLVVLVCVWRGGRVGGSSLSASHIVSPHPSSPLPFLLPLPCQELCVEPRVLPYASQLIPLSSQAQRPLLLRQLLVQQHVVACRLPKLDDILTWLGEDRSIVVRGGAATALHCMCVGRVSCMRAPVSRRLCPWMATVRHKPCPPAPAARSIAAAPRAQRSGMCHSRSPGP